MRSFDILFAVSDFGGCIGNGKIRYKILGLLDIK